MVKRDRNRNRDQRHGERDEGETWRNDEETWRNDGETMEKQGEAREKVESAKKGKNAGWRKWEQVNGLLDLNQQMIQDILQLRMSQVHGQDNPIVVDDSSEGDVLDTAPVSVPKPVVYTLVPISELTESRKGSEGEEEESDSEDEIWEISQEEFVGSSPEL